MQQRDLAIVDATQDKLNFKPFASKIAKGILNYSQAETLIFSIEGEWGSGKTSLINLIKNEIKNDVEVLHFNPWLLTDIRQVIKLFFEELIRVLSYGSFEVKLNEDIIKDLIKFASLILPESLNIDVGFIKLGYKPKDILLPDKEENIEKIKKKINTYLQKLDKKVVVIVDDIDRLTDVETEFIFRLTKGIADFDNLIYILLYDKGVVAKSLEKFKSENGQKYLEKIVQYSLNVPKPHTLKINELLSKELDEILSKIEIDGQSYIFQQDRWHYVQKAIKKYIKTVRDISQVINIMSFEYPIICEDVNFIDFFIITLIKLKNYELYEMIKNSPEVFFIDPNNIFSEREREKTADQIKSNFDTNLKQFHDFRDLLEISFPAMKNDIYWSKNCFMNEHKSKFMCDIYYFENYFSFAMSDDKLTMQEYYQIEKSLLANDFDTFKSFMLNIDEKKKSSIFLDMFEQLKLNNLEIKDEIENAFINILKISTLLESQDRGFFTSVPIHWNCQYIAFKIVLKHPNFDDYLQKIIIDNNEIKLNVKLDLFDDVIKKISEAHGEKEFELTQISLDKIKLKLKSELEAIHLNQIIEHQADSYIVMRFDLVAASLNTLSKEINDYIFESTENFFIILKAFMRVSTISSSSRGKYEKYSIAKDRLVKLIDLEKIDDYINTLEKRKLSDEQQKILEYWIKDDRWYE